MFRIWSGGLRVKPLRQGFGIAVAVPVFISTLTLTTSAGALNADILKSAHSTFDALAVPQRYEIAGLVLLLGALCFAIASTFALLRTRAQTAHMASQARADIAMLKEQIDRANALLFSEPQIIIAWPAADDAPEISGDMIIAAPARLPHQILALETWLGPDHAQAMEAAIDALRSHGQGFAMALTTLAGRTIEAEGRAIGGRAILRLKDLSGMKRDLIKLAARHENLLSDIDALHTLIETLPSPIWVRDTAGKLTFANLAYAHAVEARNNADAIARDVELLDRGAREELNTAQAQGEPYAARLPVIVAGKRCMFDVFALPTQTGSAGIGVDVTEVEILSNEITRMIEAHRRTLDQLPTAVAIFAADQRLIFYNTAYRTLWALEADFLDNQPTDTAVLDQLRAARKLPEQADFRSWKIQLHEAYRAIEPQQNLWHLPDGRTLRVVTTPNPEGGITYLFDDVTERLDLERRYDALTHVQGETLDNLAEGVVVFASDGRLRLHNPAFTRMWHIEPDLLAQRPHIEAIISWCRPLHADAAVWQSLRGTITGLEHRDPMSARIERSDGNVIDIATTPLPDGATLVTFHDISDTVKVEQALRERNDALEKADNLKSDFVHHVSYELRSPLTNIIGFAQLLDDALTGPPTEKQREYLGYITASSSALLAIINDILDLATIDAGTMALDLGPIDVRSTIAAAAEGVRDRLVEHNLKLNIHFDSGIGQFVADERRVRQILFNLLSNAIGFSPAGGTITLTAQRRDGVVLFSITDHGPGIPVEIQDRVFNRFETHTDGSRHRGTGLGLSIVRSFVELHGGTVTINSVVGQGTTVICTFPLEHVVKRVAAE